MPLLQINNMSHDFGGLRAVNNYNLEIEPGHVLAPGRAMQLTEPTRRAAERPALRGGAPAGRARLAPRASAAVIARH